ncbi:hypothetical protein CTI12_AA345610 [Artemisia annua]|uniref:Uncharacterized protein n=1 Tax=Artemisia annua TaxID=35608 RepID=A0A2U1MSS2_ARTAN|nr:hypothetical protein CTI12_AA345610 [Artemisia annua]
MEPSHIQIIRNEDIEELRELGSSTFSTMYHGKWRGKRCGNQVHQEEPLHGPII